MATAIPVDATAIDMEEHDRLCREQNGKARVTHNHQPSPYRTTREKAVDLVNQMFHTAADLPGGVSIKGITITVVDSRWDTGTSAVVEQRVTARARISGHMFAESN